jgi:hypothetical protein
MATPTTLPATFVSGNTLTAAEMNNLRGAFRILQVASAEKTDTTTTTSGTWADVGSLSVSITPSGTANKVLVMAFVNVSFTGDSAVNFRLVRGSTAIGVGAAASNRPQATFTVTPGATAVNSTQFAHTAVYLDSPSTTSSTTYKVQVLVGAGTGYVNRSGSDRDTTGYDARLFSSITVFEVSA